MYLAKRDSRILGIVGAGYQAHTQILAHAELFDIALIKVFDISPTAMDELITSLPGYSVQQCTLEETIDSDVICTLTPSREPIIKKEWVKTGTHINAVGADAPGKQELEPSILKESIVVVDDIRQACAAGEINVPIKHNLFTVDKVYATLGELIVGKKRGRTDSNVISIFDSTGVATEDIATAKLIYEKALDRGSGMSIEFI